MTNRIAAAGVRPSLLIDKLTAVLLSAAFLAGCEKAPEAPAEVIRVVKTVTLDTRVGEQTRRFAGVVAAAQSSVLSFQVGGNVIEMMLAAGAPVTAGQVIARLDPEPYELDLEAARSEVARAQAELTQRELDFERQQTLFRKSYISQAALDQTISALDAARSSVAYARARAASAERNVDQTRLVAPFTGTVSEQLVDPFQDVSAGQPVYRIAAEDALEVQIDVPETEIRFMHVGQPATVGFALPLAAAEPQRASTLVSGRVTEVADSAKSSNAYPVVVSLLDPPAELRDGMTAEVSVQVAASTGEGFLLPLSALIPQGQPPEGRVFRFKPDGETLEVVNILIGGVEENMIIASGELVAGDAIVVAGVSFLRPGQRVRLLEGQ